LWAACMPGPPLLSTSSQFKTVRFVVIWSLLKYFIMLNYHNAF